MKKENQSFVVAKDLFHEYSGRVDEEGYEFSIIYQGNTGPDGLIKLVEIE